MTVTLAWVPETTPRAFGRAAVISLALFVACGKSVRQDGGGDSSDSAGSGAEAGAPGGNGGTAGRGGSTGKGGSSGSSGEGGVGDPECDPPADAPIRRLNRFEYNNTVRDLFGDDSRPADALPSDFYDDATTPASAALVEGYHTLAHDFAVSVTADDETTAAFIGCDPNEVSEAACRYLFWEAFVPSVFRRPFTTEDEEEFETVFANGQALGGNFRSGVRAVVEVALQSPEFLYRPELGEPADDRDGWARPTPYEMASRLSYLYWGSTPDSGLYAAAEAGELRTAEGVRAQAERLLADPKARDVVGYFYPWLLRLHGATYPASGDSAHPTFTPEVAALLPRETSELAAFLTFDWAGGSFDSIFMSPFTYVNGPLAAFYGIPGVTGDAFRQANLDPTERVGVLTHASFLASNAFSTSTHPARRGWLIMNALLCTPVPEEPGDTPPPPARDGTTTRQFWEEATADAACQGCHALVNPLGFALEHYDEAGLYRETENGLPIDATGTLTETDAAGSFDGARELSLLIAGSADARRCFVRNWFSFSQGRSATANDECFLERLDEIFENNGAMLLRLHQELSQSDAFLYRPEAR